MIRLLTRSSPRSSENQLGHHVPHRLGGHLPRTGRTSSSKGCDPGTVVTTTQRSDPARAPRERRGPARPAPATTSPHPDGPTTTTSRLPATNVHQTVGLLSRGRRSHGRRRPRRDAAPCRGCGRAPAAPPPRPPPPLKALSRPTGSPPTPAGWRGPRTAPRSNRTPQRGVETGQVGGPVETRSTARPPRGPGIDVGAFVHRRPGPILGGAVDRRRALDRRAWASTARTAIPKSAR